MNGVTQREELAWWLALLRTPLIGARKFKLYLDFFGSPAAIFSQSATTLKSSGFSEAAIAWIKQPDWGLIENDLVWSTVPGNFCLRLNQPEYPVRLKEIADPPPVLFMQGSPAVLSSPQLAVVGSRNPSPAGAKLAFEFARSLSQRGLIITSGLALGIDAAAHRGALNGAGTTIAVTGTGLDQVYPLRNRPLADEIIEKGGVLLSELPLGTMPLASNFPRRNRIISGLALGTLVVEAALRSGSLITARMALEQGREVFALPGSPNNPLARGCNALIKQGAKLVETIDDITEELQLMFPAPRHVQASDVALSLTDNALVGLLKYIAYEPTSVDTLVMETGHKADIVAQMLLTLELDGYIISGNGGYSRVK